MGREILLRMLGVRISIIFSVGDVLASLTQGNITMAEQLVVAEGYSGPVPAQSTASAVSWGAIIAGAVVAVATTVLLSMLAAGLDLASVSPWADQGVSTQSAAVMTAIGLIVIQWVAALIGGYITGRLRTRWVGTHTHEVFFRDTAHGFTTWALATVLVFSVVGSAGASLLGAIGHGATTVAASSASAASGAAVSAAGAHAGSLEPYDLDTLFRSTSTTGTAPGAGNDSRAQAGRILEKALVTGDLPASDRAYLAQVIAAQTGISNDDAQHRVDDAFAQAKVAQTKAREAADTARKAAALAATLTALSLLVGAFIASVSAALGGRLRDLHP